MAKQLLIYESAVPVTQQRHGEWSVKSGSNFGFAKHLNAAPLMAAEFAAAASEYTIVFSGTGDQVMPAVILGMRNEENLYLGDDGSWQARYTPAFLRRYPFVFSASDDGKTLTLCIDEQFDGCNQDGRGERLFDSDGERTQYLTTVLNFQQEFQAHFQRTQAFCNKLKELKLLEPMQAMFTLNTGERASLAGFMGVERSRLKELTGDQLAELAGTDELELAYLQLHSLRNLSAMTERLTPKGDPGPGAGDADAKAEEKPAAAESKPAKEAEAEPAKAAAKPRKTNKSESN